MLVVHPGIAEGFDHFVDGQRPEGVANLGPVEGDAGHAVGLVIGDIFVDFYFLPISHVFTPFSRVAVRFWLRPRPFFNALPYCRYSCSSSSCRQASRLAHRSSPPICAGPGSYRCSWRESPEKHPHSPPADNQIRRRPQSRRNRDCGGLEKFLERWLKARDGQALEDAAAVIVQQDDGDVVQRHARRPANRCCRDRR